MRLSLVGLLTLGLVLLASEGSSEEHPGGARRLGKGGRAHPDSVVGLAFSQDGRWVASTGGGEITIWDATNGKAQIVSGGVGSVMDMRFEPLTNRLLVASYQWTSADVAVVESGQVAKRLSYVHGRLGYSGSALSVAPVATSGGVLVGCENGLAVLVDTATGQDGLKLGRFCGMAFRANRILVDEAGRQTLFKTSDDTVSVFSLPDGTRKLDYSCRTGRLTAAFSPSGDEIALVASDAVQIVDAKSGQLRASFPEPPLGYVEGLWFTEGGKSVTAFLSDGTLWTNEVTTGRSRRRGLGVSALNAWPKPPYLTALATTPDGKRFAIALGSEVRVFDTETATERAYDR
ncbi:MAG: WD40 repeat domain-containing protein [Planctomycetota bacterium]